MTRGYGFTARQSLKLNHEFTHVQLPGSRFLKGNDEKALVYQE